jgi:hypothetical protein
MPNEMTLPLDQVEQIKKEARQLTTDEGHSKLEQLYTRYEEVYFMTAQDKPKGNTLDPNDWKITVDPSGRNAVTGMKRLLDTSEVHVQISESNGDESPASNKIEKALLRILNQSGMMRRARVEKDVNLSAVLYGPAVLAAERVDDLVKVQTKPIYKKRLEEIAKHTPFLLRAISPKESYSRWGELGMSAHLRKYKLSGITVEERWGVQGLSKNQPYWVWDWIDLENRCAWIEGRKEVLIAKPHKMPSMNIVARFAGGSSLFNEGDRQSQSFLYAHTKGEWDKRQNLFWTYLFTALFMQGLPGPLLIIDPDSIPGEDKTVKIDYTGGVRKIFGRAQATNFPVIDSDVLKIKELMDATHAESTIYKQTLGESVSGSTFSGLAMMSSAGTLPLEDPKEAIAFAFRDIFDHILQRIKAEGIDTPWIAADDIPDDYGIEVTLEPKLPQDNLRNAQVATNLGDLVSQRWKRNNILQIADSDAMTSEVLQEMMLMDMVKAMMSNEQRVDALIEQVLNRKPPAQVGAGANGAAAPAAPPETAMPPEQMQQMPDGSEMIGAAQGQPNMEQTPMGGPRTTPGERT